MPAKKPSGFGSALAEAIKAKGKPMAAGDSAPPGVLPPMDLPGPLEGEDDMGLGDTAQEILDAMTAKDATALKGALQSFIEQVTSRA